MTDPTHPVLVAVDGTASGLEAVSLGSALAVLTGAPLVLGAVYGSESGTFGGLVWPPHDDAEQWLQTAAGRLGDAVAWSACSTPAPSIAQGLVTLAEREDAGVIVLGPSHRGHLGRVLVGSTARQVVQGAPCAVAVAPHQWRLRPLEAPITVGAALSDTPESREALAFAAQLAAPAHARLRVFTVAYIPPPAHPMFATTSYAGWVKAQRRAAEHCARDALATVAPTADADVLVLEGDPLERLAGASRELDLLVVGSRRYGPVRRTLLGSVSSPLIERAACPVIVVPRGVHAHLEEVAPAGVMAHA